MNPPAADDSDCCWTLESDLDAPRARHGHAMHALTGGRLLLIGGGDRQRGLCSGVDFYDPFKRRWSHAAAVDDVSHAATERAAFASVLLTDQQLLLVHGGMTAANAVSNACWILDTRSLMDAAGGRNMRWTRVTVTKNKAGRLPRPRLGHSLTLVARDDDGSYRLLLLAGLGSEDGCSAHEDFAGEYLSDAYVGRLRVQPRTSALGTARGHGLEATLTWLPLIVCSEEAPTARESHVALALDANHVLLMGGMNGRRLDDAWILNVTQATWKRLSIKTPCPNGRSLAAAVNVDGHIMMFGGWTAATAAAAAGGGDDGGGTKHAVSSSCCCRGTSDRTSNDLWSLDVHQRRWTRVLPAVNLPWPPATAGHAM